MRRIHALDRGLQVLLAVTAAGSATLHELHGRTGIPKASLLRILLTLGGRGMVWRRISDGRYRAGQSFTNRMRYPSRTERLVQTASPVLDDLCARIGWPSDLAIPKRDYMEICETNRPHAPIHLNRELVGLKIPTLHTAHGRAYLAACEGSRRDAALSRLRASQRRGNEMAHDRAWVARVVRETRALGYGTRDPRFGGHFYKSKRDHNDGLLAIAVPVLVRSSVIATINIVWVERVATAAQMAARHLGDLRDAAQRISDTVEAMAS